MQTYFLFGKYSQQSLGQVSADRSKKAVGIIEKLGGKMTSKHATLGETDLVFVADLPSGKEAFKASIALAKLTGISFTTAQAITIEEFDRLAKEV